MAKNIWISHFIGYRGSVCIHWADSKSWTDTGRAFAVDAGQSNFRPLQRWAIPKICFWNRCWLDDGKNNQHMLIITIWFIIIESIHLLSSILQNKMYPHFGASEQVGFTYFSYKICCIIMGLVAHEPIPKNYIYICDKFAAGDKNGNHTTNYLLKYEQP